MLDGDRTPKTFRLVLKQPFPLLLDVLGKPNAPLPVMMPARLAATPADQRIPEPIGSGPFRFVKDQWRPGNAMMLERNAAYVPRKEAPDFLTGGKNVKIDQLTLARDARPVDRRQRADGRARSTTCSTCRSTCCRSSRRTRSVKLLGLGGIHQFQGNFRLNHAFPPFDNPAVRQVDVEAGRPGLDTRRRSACPTAIARRTCSSFWMCGTPLSTDAGCRARPRSIWRRPRPS